MSVNQKLLLELQFMDWEGETLIPECRPHAVNVISGILKCFDYDYVKKGSKKVLADLKRQNRTRDFSLASLCYERIDEIDRQRYEEL